MERFREILGIDDLTNPDFRCTVGTFMSRYGVPRHVRERVLNHGGLRKSDMTDGVYNIYDYDAEMRAALELWVGEVNLIARDQTGNIDGFYRQLARLKQFDEIEIV